MRVVGCRFRIWIFGRCVLRVGRWVRFRWNVVLGRLCMTPRLVRVLTRLRRFVFGVVTMLR